jgi:hypothetical protein
MSSGLFGRIERLGREIVLRNALRNLSQSHGVRATYRHFPSCQIQEYSILHLLVARNLEKDASVNRNYFAINIPIRSQK